MAHFPDSFATELQVLTPAYDLGPAGNEAVLELAERNLVTVVGLPECYAGSLAVIGAQRHIEEYCANDIERFGTKGATRAWLQKPGGRGMVWIGDVPGRKGPLEFDEMRELTDEDVRMLAYGWAGNERNKRIPGANVTTAYRVGEFGQRQYGGLGRPLGTLVVATAVEVFGAEPDEISLETWFSNDRARHIYDDLGFIQVGDRVEDVRPTLQPIGTVINGHAVYLGTDKHGRPHNMVVDEREYRQYAPEQAAIAA